VRSPSDQSEDLGQAYFDEFYTDYYAQNPQKKLRFYLHKIRKYMGDGVPIFEIGCGKGVFLAYAAAHGHPVSGCDVNSHAVESTARLLHGAPIYHGEFAPPPKGRLEVVAAYDVVEHMRNVEAAFRRIHSSLKPGGMFFFVCPVYDSLLGWVVRLLDKDPTHVHKWSRFRWLALARSTGFQIVGWTGIVRYLVTKRFYLHVPMPGPLKSLAPAILVVCRTR